jgi:catalase
MQAVMGGAAQTVKEAMTATGPGTSKKINDLKADMVHPSDKDLMTSDFGVRQSNTDNWLSASSNDKKGPLLLEDNWAREKVKSTRKVGNCDEG